MSRKSKGECTCKIVAQNERGMLGQVRDSVYRGVKYYGEDGQVEKRFCFPRKLAEEKWLEWLDADLTEDELRILEPLNRKQRRVAKRANEHNAKLKAELEEERNVEGRPKNSENRLTQRMRKLIAERNEKPPVLQSGLHNEPAEEQSESHEAGSDALSKECDEWQQLALDYDAENRELNVQLAELEASLAEATAKVDALEHGLSNRNVPAAQAAFVLDAIPETLMDVLKVAERQWPDRIVLTDASWKGAEDWNDNEGNIPDEYDIVKSVATVLYDMAINGMPYEGEFSQAFQNETGFELALKEGSQTKKNGKMMDKRSVEYDGKEYGMQMHVKGRKALEGEKEVKPANDYHQAEGGGERASCRERAEVPEQQGRSAPRRVEHGVPRQVVR